MKKIDSLSIYLFASIFAVVLPYCFFGFDITDHGYILYEGKNAFELGFFKAFFEEPTVFLSNYLGGILQTVSITGTFVESRVHGLLIYCLAAVLIYSIVRSLDSTGYAKKNSALLILIYALLAINPFKSGAILVPSYDTLPVLFYAALIFQLFKFYQTDKRRWLIGAYIAFAALTLIKITLILTFGLFVVLACLSLWEKKSTLRLQIALLIVAGLSSLVFGLWIMNHDSSELRESYGMAQLFKIYWKDFTKSPLEVFTIIVLLAVGTFAEGHRWLRMIFGCALMTLGLMLIQTYSASYPSETYDWLFKYKHMFAYSVTIVMMIGTLVLLIKNRKASGVEKFVLIAAFLFPCLLNFGTNNGLQKMAHGVLLMPPLLYMYGSRYYPRAASVFIRVSLLIGWIAILNMYTSYYRDSANPGKLTATFDHSKLKFTRTTPERKEAFQSLLQETEKYIQKGDVILSYDYNPMLYWVTETKAIEGLSWPHLLTIDQVKRKTNDMCSSSENTPKIAVRTVASPFNKEWPVQSVNLKSDDQAVTDELYRTMVQLCKFKMVWTNQAFEIWQ